MKVSIEKKKIEAVKRMKHLDIFPDIVKAFEEEGKVARSEPPFGAHYWVDDDDKKIIEEFEKENNALVYTAIRTYTDIGIMTSYLFVSDYDDEWEMDWQNMEDNMVFAYVYNHDDPHLSEMGSIGVKRTMAAGLCRVW